MDVIVPVVGDIGPWQSEAHDQDYFLRMFDRGFPFDYLNPMKVNPFSGYEIFQSDAKVGERVSLAIDRTQAAALIMFATGGSFATGLVTFTRPAPGTPFILMRGTTVSTEGGRDFVLTQDLEFDGATTALSGTVQAVAKGYEWNLRGSFTALNGDLIPGPIDRVKLSFQDPPLTELNLGIAAVQGGTAGGSPGTLDALGKDIGFVRRDFETDYAYRIRLRSLPDVVSPAAINRIVTALLAPFGLTYQYVEAGDPLFQTCWDAPSPNPGTPTYQAVAPLSNRYDDTTFVYDDPRDPSPYRNRWLDRCEATATFYIVVDAMIPELTYALAFDDPGMVPADFFGPPQHGTSAFDMPANPSSVIAPGAYDGDTPPGASIYASLYLSLQAAKAGGVNAIIVKAGS
jgi:hypothetical protein